DYYCYSSDTSVNLF
nr:immunoglobulin light chain junction region [Macaca mulatta]MOW70785.1 immunoglobulin light chain junction region [Macaca mulatta]